jgi:hypothetical protein
MLEREYQDEYCAGSDAKSRYDKKTRPFFGKDGVQTTKPLKQRFQGLCFYSEASFKPS